MDPLRGSVGMFKRLFECADCGVGYEQRDSLIEHLINDHNVKPEEEDDEEDDLNGSNSGSIKSESESSDVDYNPHTDLAESRGNRHRCRFCPKSFHRNFCLKRHERKHTGERPYRCRECGRRFSDRSNLIQHERSRHSEAKTYICTTCQRKFTQYCYLRRHIRNLHQHKISFICPEPCNLGFTSEKKWQEHVRQHDYPVKAITVNHPNAFKAKHKLPPPPLSRSSNSLKSSKERKKPKTTSPEPNDAVTKTNYVEEGSISQPTAANGAQTVVRPVPIKVELDRAGANSKGRQERSAFSSVKAANERVEQ